MTAAASVPALILRPTFAGDVLHVAGDRREVLEPPCTTTYLAYACVSCQARLANQHQLELHLEHGGTHFICGVCPEHGPEGIEQLDLPNGKRKRRAVAS